jgi:transposase
MSNKPINTPKATRRQEWIQAVADGKLSRTEAAQRLALSARQVWRLLQRYRTEGLGGLTHRLVHRPSNHRHPPEFKERILALMRDKYFDFGPTLAAEHLLAEEGLAIHRDTLCRWLKAHHLLTKVRQRRPHRQHRERNPRFGQLLQIDGSHHPWFGPHHPKACLLNLIDDATSTNLCLFDTAETVQAAVRVLWLWLKKYGIPQAIYADRRNACISQALTEANGLFGQLCRRLDIRTIPAFSPQAKGRVERSNQTHQDRLVKELRLARITTIDAANAFLKATYLPNHNRRFARSPEEPVDVHRRLLKNATLDDFCFTEAPRKVANDWTVKFNGALLQIKRKYYCPAKSTVWVRQTFSGQLQIRFKNQKLAFAIAH